MTTLYAITLTPQPRTDRLCELLLIELRCEECDEVHRLALDGGGLDAVRALNFDVSETRPAHRRVLERAAAVHAASLVPEVVRALVWQLTHATSHNEQERRDASR